MITGETGAGKSLLIGALRLLLGERADKSMIRSSETTCGIEAIFELNNPSDANAVLEEFGLPPCDGGLLIIRRTITERSSMPTAPLTANNTKFSKVWKNETCELIL